MSTQPIRNLADEQSSPPIKNRKVLSDQTNTIMSSPHYGSSKKPTDFTINAFTLPQAPFPLDITKKQHEIQRTTNIPGAYSNVRERLQRYSHAGAALEKSSAEKASRRTSYHSNMNSLELQALKDPAAVKKQQLNYQNSEKMVVVLREKLNNMQQKKKQAEIKVEDLKMSKSKLKRSAIEYRNRISDSQMMLDRSQHKTIMARDQLEKLKITEKHMNILQLEQLRNTTDQQLTEFELELKKELQTIESFNDEEGKEKIKALQVRLQEKENQLNKIRESNEKTLENRKMELQSELDKIVQAQEVKDEEFSKKYEEEAVKLEEMTSSIQLEKKHLNILNQQIAALDSDIKKEKEMNNIHKQSNGNLVKELEGLKLQSTALEVEADVLSREEDNINEVYQQGLSKLHKEQKLRYRIQNSIEELEGKLRVYVRVLASDTENHSRIHCNQEDDNLTQTLTIDDQSFIFDKVFSTDKNDETIIQELVSLTEHNLNGGNVSYIFNDFSKNQFIKNFIISTKEFLTSVEIKDRYQHNNWGFKYTYQIISITEKATIDLSTGENTDIEIRDRQICSNASLITDYQDIESLFEQNIPSESTTLIKLIVNASNKEKSFTATTTILNIPSWKSEDQVLNVIKDIKYGNLDTHPENVFVYRVLHHLYTNTKALSLFNITNDKNDEDNLEILNVASFMHSIDAAPAKNVYSKRITNQ